MSIESAYAAPKAEVLESSGNHVLLQMSTKDLTKFYLAGRNIRALCYLYCLFSVLAAIGVLGLLTAPPRPDDDVNLFVGYIAIVAVFCGYAFLMTYAVLQGQTWGRIMLYIMCILLLLNIPIGTLLGVLGMVALSHGERYFGADRISYADTKKEYKYRRKYKLQ